MRAPPAARATQWRWLALTALGVVFGFPLFLGWRCAHVDAVHASVVTGVLPLATAVVGALVLRQRAAPGVLGCAVAGCALVLGVRRWRGGAALAGRRRPAAAGGAQRGVRLCSGARLSAAMPAEQVICWVLVLSLPLTLPLALATLAARAGAASAWVGFAYVALFSMWLGFFAWYRGLALGGTRAREPGAAAAAVPVDAAGRADARRDARRRHLCCFAGRDGRRVRRPAHAAAAHRRPRASRTARTRPFREAHERIREHDLDPRAPRAAHEPVDHPRDPEAHRAPGRASRWPAACRRRTRFPVEAMREACPRCCATRRARRCSTPPAKASAPLREWVAAAICRARPARRRGQVLITTGSQQGLDLVGKVLIDAGSRVAVETPTYLGALQAFDAYEPEFVAVDCDDDGPAAASAHRATARRARASLYLLPNFQNPSGR